MLAIRLSMQENNQQNKLDSDFVSNLCDCVIVCNHFSQYSFIKPKVVSCLALNHNLVLPLQKLPKVYFICPCKKFVKMSWVGDAAQRYRAQVTNST